MRNAFGLWLCAGLIAWANLAPAATVTNPALTEAVALYEQIDWPEMSEDDLAGDDQLLPDLSPAADHLREASLREVRSRITDIPAAELDDKDRITLALLKWTVDESIDAAAFDESRIAFNSDGGFDLALNYRADRTRPVTIEQAEHWLAVLAGVPDYYRANLDNLRRGIKMGFVLPRITVESVLPRARKAAAVPVAEDPLLVPLLDLPDSIPKSRRAALIERGRVLIRDQVGPARAGFVRFLEAEYLPAATTSLAVSSLPDGEAYYRFLVRRHTTTTTTPEQIFELGQREVVRIRARMQAVMEEVGFDGTLSAFIASLRADPQFVAASRQDLLEKASEIAKRVDGLLPAHFKTLPRLSYGVRAVPADIEDGYTTGRYFSGDPDKGRAGGLMINTSHLDQRPLYELPALVLHEGAPGHHIQIALAQEQDEVPDFRRELYFTPFGEGWGLYAERLGESMGIYRDAYEQFGRLSYEMWRACRLVADTGIHWKHWSFEQARACFADNTALSPLNIDIELQRYVSWPGQALGYKIGELKLVELRSRAEAALGTDFDERAFHDAVLLNGSLPMTVLEQQVDAWIAARKLEGT